MAVEEYLSLEEAAKRYGIPDKALVEMATSGAIRAAKVGGKIAVNKGDVAAIAITVRREQFQHLANQGISISEASSKYLVPHSTLRSWANQGHIRVLSERQQGKRVLLDEQDVAFGAALYHLIKEKRGRTGGVRVFRLVEKGQ